MKDEMDSAKSSRRQNYLSTQLDFSFRTGG